MTQNVLHRLQAFSLYFTKNLESHVQQRTPSKELGGTFSNLIFLRELSTSDVRPSNVVFHLEVAFLDQRHVGGEIKVDGLDILHVEFVSTVLQAN